ncbi:hypothetical protein PENTCL1PPCAC_29920, partial [Pristionchus entomophagus]
SVSAPPTPAPWDVFPYDVPPPVKKKSLATAEAEKEKRQRIESAESAPSATAPKARAPRRSNKSSSSSKQKQISASSQSQSTPTAPKTRMPRRSNKPSSTSKPKTPRSTKANSSSTTPQSAQNETKAPTSQLRRENGDLPASPLTSHSNDGKTSGGVRTSAALVGTGNVTTPTTPAIPMTPEQAALKSGDLRAIANTFAATVWNGRLECFGFANIFTAEEVPRMRRELLKFAERLHTHDANKKAWAKFSEQHKPIKMRISLRQRLTEIMNETLRVRKGGWNLELSRSRPVNYRFTRTATDNLEMRVSHDAKSLIFFYADNTEERKEVEELVDEKWSDEGGRSTKELLVKITTQDQPEYYIAKHILDFKDKEYARWNELFERTGKKHIHVPGRIPHEWMNEFILYRLRSRELDESYGAWYEKMFFAENNASSLACDYIDSAVKEAIDKMESQGDKSNHQCPLVGI